VADGWDARIRLIDDQTALQQEMDSLAKQFSSAEQASVLEQYAFTPAHPKPIAYLTANFLRGGWLHLIGNMWFLWLAGATLEGIHMARAVSCAAPPRPRNNWIERWLTMND
jgi:Rhomboid family